MRTRSTLAITKASLRLTRLLGKGAGTALPGLIAERLQPDLPGRLAAQLPHGVILVTGTNGKTTTSKILVEMMEASGEKVLSNRAGSNLRRGITSTLIRAAKANGRIDATIGIFEVDEATLPLVSAELKPKAILVLNLFRDQLDRYGELDTLAAVIGRGIGQTTADLYLNADDPLVASLAQYGRGEVYYYGVNDVAGGAGEALVTATDSDRCPSCGTKLDFSVVFYGHIGHYSCPRGDFARPQPELVASKPTDLGKGRQGFRMKVGEEVYETELPLPGTYNLYNALGAASVALGNGVSVETVTSVMAVTKAAFGRVEQVKVGSKILYLLLIKNPAGFTQIIETFLRGKVGVPVLFAINDNAADGRDVSWLWDVPLEAIAGDELKALTTGIRGTDMAVRLKYAGIESHNVADLNQAVAELLRDVPEGGTGYVLPTYTAMLELRAILARQATLDEVWQ